LEITIFLRRSPVKRNAGNERHGYSGVEIYGIESASLTAMTKKTAKRKKKLSPRAEARAIFENLAEQEKIKGHHSNEGMAIRVLSRGLSGWLERTLSHVDAYVLCDETLQQWLRRRVTGRPWSSAQFEELLVQGLEEGSITEDNAGDLVLLRAMRIGVVAGKMRLGGRQVVAALRISTRLVESYW
jgi:hypothetical protein